MPALSSLYNLPSDQLYDAQGRLQLPATTGSGEPLDQLIVRLFPGLLGGDSSDENEGIAEGGGLAEGQEDTGRYLRAQQRQALTDALVWGDTQPFLDQIQASGNPQARQVVDQLRSNANLKDKNSLLGDNFFGAVTILALATGAAGLYGPVAGVGVTAAEAAGLAGEGALFASTPGTLGAVGAGLADIAPLAATFPAAGLTAPTIAGTGGLELGGLLAAAEPGITGLTGIAPEILGGVTPVLEGGAGGFLGTGLTIPQIVGGVGTLAGLPDTIGSLVPDGGGGGGGGGILGSGITLNDLAKVAGPLATLGTGIVGGVVGADATKDATDAQVKAGEQANILLREIYAQQRADQEPFRQAGVNALPQLQTLAGSRATIAPFVPTPVLTPGEPVGPLRAAPALGALKAAPYAFTPPTAETLVKDPGYQFRLQEGLKAINAQASARGQLNAGGRYKALNTYAQGSASQEFQNAYQRAITENERTYGRAQTEHAQSQTQDEQNYARTQQQRAQEVAVDATRYGREQAQNAQQYERAANAYQTNYNVEQQQEQQQFNRLASLAGIGHTAANTLTNVGGQFGSAAAAGIQNIGNARAAGEIGTANAWQNALTAAGAGVTQLARESRYGGDSTGLTLSQLLALLKGT